LPISWTTVKEIPEMRNVITVSKLVMGQLIVNANTTLVARS